jgi:hypothetical protein
MNAIMNWSRHSTAMRVISGIAVDATLCAVCGGLYGLIYAGVGMSVHGETWRLISSAGFFALCGGLAGALIGTRNAFVKTI